MTLDVLGQPGLDEQTDRMRSRRIASLLLTALGLSLLLPACAALRRSDASRAQQPLFVGTLQELIPHAPGDRFFYTATGGAGGDRKLTGAVMSSERADEVLFTIFQGRLVLNQTRMRDDGKTLSLVGEVGPQQNIGVSYEEPLPIVETPLYPGTYTFRTAVKMLRLPQATVFAVGEIEQIAVVERGERFDRDGEILVRLKRRMILPDREVVSRTLNWIVPGRGWVKSRLTIGEGPEERRDLLCAVVDGILVGDCEPPVEQK